MRPDEAALMELGRALRATGYRFVTPTPETHRRVNERARQMGAEQARDLRDVFGWSRPFAPELLPQHWLGLLEAAGELVPAAGLLRAGVRFSSLGELLLVHSAFPTSAADAVFFGPDTYRFCALLEHWAPTARRVVDLGCGSGAGGLCLQGRVGTITLADVNPRALRYSRVNAALTGVDAEVVQSDVLEGVAGPVDLIIANPPYLLDAAARTYRHGGGALGEGLSVRMVREALPRLHDGGTLIVYTGSAIVAGRDSFQAAVTPILAAAGVDFAYRELDPDVFGEELSSPGYAQVDRIAVVALRVRCGGKVASREQR